MKRLKIDPEKGTAHEVTPHEWDSLGTHLATAHEHVKTLRFMLGTEKKPVTVKSDVHGNLFLEFDD